MIADLLTRGVRHMLSGISAPDQWLIDWARGGEETSSGEHINEQNAVNCPAVKAAVSLLSESLALSSIEICEQTDPEKVTVVKDHPVTALLNRSPNPETNAMTWWDMMQNHHGTWGNGYAYIQRTVRGDKIAALWNRKADPQRTRPVRSKVDKQIYYECRDEGGNVEAMVPAADMLHVRYMSLDGILGKSPVRMIRETIGGNRAAERFANELFKNGDVAHGYFEHPGKLSQPAYDRLKSSLAEKAAHGERHRKQILEEGMKFSGTSYNLEQMQMIAAREYLDLAIARAYNIDAQLLQMAAAGTMNLSDLGRKFVNFTLALWGERWTAEINAKLLKPPFFARWNFSVFLRNDRQAMAQEHRTNFAVGKQSINEMRHERGDNRLDDPNADEHFVPLNMVPLSLASEFAKAVIAKGKTPTQNPDGGDPSEEKPGGVPDGSGFPGSPTEPEGGRPKNEEGGGELGANRIASQLALLEAEAIVAETLRRMDRIEANEATRAAKDPKTFLSRLDAFYAKHVETIREALERPVRTSVLLRDGPLAGGLATDCEIDNIINEHVGGKRNALLQAAECRPGELVERVADVVKGWGGSNG